MNVDAYIECPKCEESATIDFQRKRGTIKMDCGCDRREIILEYSESVVIG